MLLHVVALSVALGGTWPYRAPVPTQPPSDGKSFSVCLELSADLGFDNQAHQEGNVSWTCASDEARSTVCYDVGATGWPESWPDLTCEGEKDRVKVTLVPSFDPAADPTEGVRISRSVDEATAVFVVGNRFPAQSVEGARGTKCQVTDGRLYVSRTTRSRRRDVCTLRRKGGAVHIKVR